MLHWSFFLFLNLFRSSCCLVASCEFVAAFAACVVTFCLKFLFINQRGFLALQHKTPKVLWRPKKYIKIRAQISYEPKIPKLLWAWDHQKYINTRHKKKKTSGPKNYVRKRLVFEHNTKSLMNLRPQKLYESKTPNKKLWTQGPKNHTNRRRITQHVLRMHLGGRAQPTPHQFFFLGLPPLQRQPTPTWNVSTSNWNHRKKINSQNTKKLIPKIFPHPWKLYSRLEFKFGRLTWASC